MLDSDEDFSSPALSQAQDLQYESYLRTLQQVQDKRAVILEQLHGKGDVSPAQALNPTDSKSLTEISLELKDCLRYFTPLEEVGTNDITGHVVRPTPRQVKVDRPVQYTGRNICHPVPQALRRPRGSSLDYSSESARFPLKKRPYILAPEGEGPPSKAVRAGVIEHYETSGFYKYLPRHAIKEYPQDCQSKDVEMTAIDGEVSETMHDASSENKVFPFSREFRTRELIPEASPPFININPEGSDINLVTPTDMSENSQSDENDSDDDTDNNDVASEVAPNPEATAASRPKRTMEEVRRYVLTNDKSSDRQRDNRRPQTEAEQFVEVLEDFLEENPDLAPHDKDNVLEMLINMRAKVAREKEKEATPKRDELCMDDSDDGLDLAQHERSADVSVSFEETEESQSQATPAITTCDSQVGKYLPINSVDVEMDRTGQEIYDEIATFFGYDGYIDYLTYEVPAEEEDEEQGVSMEMENDTFLLE